MSRCHATYRAWAPAGWEPPEADPKSYERLADAERWSRGAFDAEDRLVATAAWEQFKASDGSAAPGVAHVSAVFVDPARWRQGIATGLLSQAEQAMRERATASLASGLPRESRPVTSMKRRDGARYACGTTGFSSTTSATRSD